MTVDVVTGELVPATTRPDLLTAAPADDVLELQRQFLALCVALLDESDFQAIGGKRYKTKSAWRKLAAAFNVSDELVERIFDRDDDVGRIVRAEYVVKATAPNGRSAVGIGISSVYEPRKFANPEHDIPATAHTRAKNRAFADLFGLGEVSADEIVEHSTGGDRSDSGAESRRRSADKPSGGASSRQDPVGRASPRPAVSEPTASGVALETRVDASPDAVRSAFREWRKSKGYGDPSKCADEVVAEMVGEFERIAAAVKAEADAYGR